MSDIEGLLGRLTQGELEQLRALRPDGFLPGSLVSAIDRASGGPGEGRGYYVLAKPVVPREFIAYVLRPDVAGAVASLSSSGAGTAASGPTAAGADSQGGPAPAGSRLTPGAEDSGHPGGRWGWRSDVARSQPASGLKRGTPPAI